MAPEPEPDPATATATPNGRSTRSPREALRNRRNAPVAEPLRLADLPKSEHRRAVLTCAARVIGAWILIFGAYYLLPGVGRAGFRAFLHLATDIAVVAAVLVWQVRHIHTARLPELRAIEALGVVVALFLAAFASIYLGMSNGGPHTFTQTLDHTRALYFTITVFSTVGFGDITPRTDTARLVVSAQMLLDLAIIGAVVRLIFSAARTRVGASAAPSEG
jgi:voltage-gated potassium channel